VQYAKPQLLIQASSQRIRAMPNTSTNLLVPSCSQADLFRPWDNIPAARLSVHVHFSFQIPYTFRQTHCCVIKKVMKRKVFFKIHWACLQNLNYVINPVWLETHSLRAMKLMNVYVYFFNFQKLSKRSKKQNIYLICEPIILKENYVNNFMWDLEAYPWISKSISSLYSI